MKSFKLYRIEDESGISGTGYVGVGHVFPSGRVVMEWTVPPHALNMYMSVSDLLEIHGHGGKTHIVWDEDIIKGNPINLT